ncbi:DUF6725 family protein [Paraoerskovia marina]|nr:DUF6725 family protein [Paraoerskovia marina]
MSTFGESGSAPWTAWPVGARVMVRQRLRSAADGGHAPRYTDILGDVVAVGPEGVRLSRDAPRRGHPDPWEPGCEVFVPADEIAVGKRVPPRPARRARRAPTSED